LVTLYCDVVVSPSWMSATFSVMHVCYILFCTVNVAYTLELTKPNLIKDVAVLAVVLLVHISLLKFSNTIH
jgi:hypothetical protein